MELKFARKHHYIPEFYLAGFTPSGGKDDFLWVFDHAEGKKWKAKPGEVAHQRDFYRIDATGVSPDIIEKAFGEFESAVASVLKKIIESKSLPTGDEFTLLANFVALIAVRTPPIRKNISKPLEQLATLVMETILATPERWTTTIEKMRAKGIPIGKEITYESMRQFISSEDYEIQINQNWYINIILDMVKTILPLLMHRKWSILVATDNAGDFVCSDCPVALIWTKPMPAIYGPGFGMKDTELTIPLSKEIALIARFEGQSEVYEADRRLVASLNSRTGMYVDRFVFSSDEEFFWIRSDEVICNGSDLLEAIRVKKRT